MTNATIAKPISKCSRNAAGKSDAESDVIRATTSTEASKEVTSLHAGPTANVGHTDAPSSAKALSKTALVLDLLRRPDGATINQLAEATGWLPHTTRAALTGLKKKGHAVTRIKRGEISFYQVAL